MLQPWVDRQDGLAGDGVLPDGAARRAPRDPLAPYRQALLDALGELFLLGLTQADEAALRSWRDLHRQGASLGFVRLLHPVARLVAVLEEKSWTVKWEAAGAITAPLELVSYSLLMQEDVDGKC